MLALLLRCVDLLQHIPLVSLFGACRNMTLKQPRMRPIWGWYLFGNKAVLEIDFRHRYRAGHAYALLKELRSCNLYTTSIRAWYADTNMFYLRLPEESKLWLLQETWSRKWVNSYALMLLVLVLALGWSLAWPCINAQTTQVVHTICRLRTWALITINTLSTGAGDGRYAAYHLLCKSLVS